MSNLNKLSLGQACAYVLLFGVVIVLLHPFGAGKTPEAVAGLVTGNGLGMLALMVFRRPNPLTQSRAVAAVAVVAATLAASLAAAAAVSWLT